MAAARSRSNRSADVAAQGAEPRAASSLAQTLEARFDAHPQRHPGVHWAELAARLTPSHWATLERMEASGGEPDVVRLGDASTLWFVDCAAESPAGRRSLCYDRDGWLARKDARPLSSVEEAAAELGAELLDEHDYRALQQLGAFDQKTSSWLRTPPAIRAHGGALFGDRRYEHVFIYHNGAQSYYAARGFRAKLRLAETAVRAT